MAVYFEWKLIDAVGVEVELEEVLEENLIFEKKKNPIFLSLLVRKMTMIQQALLMQV